MLTKRATTLAAFILLLSVFHNCMAAVRFANSYKVTGDISVTYFQTPDETYSTKFQVTVDGCKVVIRTEGFGGDRLEFSQFATDGIDSYVLEKHLDSTIISNTFDAVTRQEVPLKKPRKPLSANLWFSPQPLPSLAGLKSPLWLAYGSKCYLSSKQSGDLLEPSCLFLIGLDRDLWRVKEHAFWQWESEASFIRNLICIRDDSSLMRRDLYFGEFTNATFSVLGWTNFASTRFPMRFEMRIIEARRLKDATVGPMVTAKIWGVATNVCFLTKSLGDVFPRQLTNSAWVVDGRAAALNANGEPAAYVSMDGKIKSFE